MPDGPNIGFIRPEVLREMPKWVLVCDTVVGEIAVKAKKEVYLPKPETHVDTTINNTVYKKYLLRAVFFPVTGRTLAGLCGQVFSKPIVVDLPTDLQPLEEDIDGAGTTLEQQAKRTLQLVLKTGRSGLLSDFPRVDPGKVVTRADLQTGKFRPRVVLYEATQIINWRLASFGGEIKLSLLVLLENMIVKDDGFEFKTEPRWRVYRLNEDGSGVTVEVWKRVSNTNTNTEKIEYVLAEAPTEVMGANQQPLSKIPFAFVGAENNDAAVDESPLYPLSQLNIAHYRNSADYEQSLFIVGQATPVFTGLSQPWVDKNIEGKVTFGSSTPIALPVGATASLLQALPNSMPMEGMTHKEDQMKAVGAKLIEPGTVERTATEAEIEEVSEASVLSSVAKNVSAAYELALFHCSLFIKEANPDTIEIALNSEFQVTGLNAAERKEVLEAWQGGAVTWEELREVYRRKGIATEKDEDARVKIVAEGLEFGNNNDEDTA